jgi:DNA replication protein DnaC
MDEIKNNLLRALQAHAERDIQPFDQTTARIYTMDFAYEGKSHFPVDRFKETRTHGVLYRPAIVAAMKRTLNTLEEGEGLFVRGPEGIGKSHSLVNLVRSLRADGHIVTFIPTCQDFVTHADFLIALLKSIESSMTAIGVSRSFATKDNVDEILDCIE